MSSPFIKKYDNFISIANSFYDLREIKHITLINQLHHVEVILETTHGIYEHSLYQVEINMIKEAIKNIDPKLL